MPSKISGCYKTSTVAGESVQAFVPNPLPPEDFQLSPEIQYLNEQANRALGRLDMATLQLPDLGQFLYVYIRKEALLSSQIEGTQSSFADLLLFENNELPGVPLDDVVEVSNYVAAINHGLKRIREDDFPVCVRLIKELHSILLRKGRGEHKTPGEFRQSQNWIGGTRPGNAGFVPPPKELVEECMSDLEKFIHDDTRYIPVIIRTGMVHIQFETIHPFLDGNGRLGRLLIPLLLCSKGVLKEPILYLSVFFKGNRNEYYELLQKVRTESDWESWLRFFLRGVIETADQAVGTALELRKLFESDGKLIESIGRAAGSALRVHECLRHNPVQSIAGITKKLTLSYPAVSKAMKNLEELGIVRLLRDREKGKIFYYEKYLRILERGTEPLQ